MYLTVHQVADHTLSLSVSASVIVTPSWRQDWPLVTGRLSPTLMTSLVWTSDLTSRASVLDLLFFVAFYDSYNYDFFPAGLLSLLKFLFSLTLARHDEVSHLTPVWGSCFLRSKVSCPLYWQTLNRHVFPSLARGVVVSSRGRVVGE